MHTTNPETSDLVFRIDKWPRLTLTAEETRDLITDLYCEECGEQVEAVFQDTSIGRTSFECDCRATNFSLRCVNGTATVQHVTTEA